MKIDIAKFPSVPEHVLVTLTHAEARVLREQMLALYVLADLVPAQPGAPDNASPYGQLCALLERVPA